MQQLDRDPLQSLVIHAGVRLMHAGALMYPHTVSTPVAIPESALTRRQSLKRMLTCSQTSTSAVLTSAPVHFNQRHRYE